MLSDDVNERACRLGSPWTRTRRASPAWTRRLVGVRLTRLALHSQGSVCLRSSDDRGWSLEVRVNVSAICGARRAAGGRADPEIAKHAAPGYRLARRRAPALAARRSAAHLVRRRARAKASHTHTRDTHAHTATLKGSTSRRRRRRRPRHARPNSLSRSTSIVSRPTKTLLVRPSSRFFPAARRHQAVLLARLVAPCNGSCWHSPPSRERGTKADRGARLNPPPPLSRARPLPCH